jgi:hypothetical protein
MESATGPYSEPDKSNLLTHRLHCFFNVNFIIIYDRNLWFTGNALDLHTEILGSNLNQDSHATLPCFSYIHDSFLPNPFQLFIHHSRYHTTLYNALTHSVKYLQVKVKLAL